MTILIVIVLICYNFLQFHLVSRCSKITDFIEKFQASYFSGNENFQNPLTRTVLQSPLNKKPNTDSISHNQEANFSKSLISSSNVMNQTLANVQLSNTTDDSSDKSEICIIEEQQGDITGSKKLDDCNKTSPVLLKFKNSKVDVVGKNRVYHETNLNSNGLKLPLPSSESMSSSSHQSPEHHRNESEVETDESEIKLCYVKAHNRKKQVNKKQVSHKQKKNVIFYSTSDESEEEIVTRKTEGSRRKKIKTANSTSISINENIEQKPLIIPKSQSAAGAENMVMKYNSTSEMKEKLANYCLLCEDFFSSNHLKIHHNSEICRCFQCSCKVENAGLLAVHKKFCIKKK